MRGALAVCLVATAALHAAQDGQPPPTFRSGVQLIEVDVTVRDRDGRLARDLAAGDFELLEDGVPQDLVSFRLVDLPIDMAAGGEEPRAARVEPDVTSNTTTGRVYVVLLDNPPGVPWSHVYLTQRTARRFVDEALAPDDLTALIDLHSGSGSHPFTRNRQRLLASIDRFGQGALGFVPLFGPEQRHDPAGPYETMRFVAERLGALGNRRKAIVWIGGVVPFHHQFASTAVAYRDAVRAAERNNVAIYPVDPYGLTIAMGRAELERVSALRAAAEDTGGYAVVNTNNFSGGYRRIVEENSTYYVLGYYPASPRQDGRFHEIDVRVRRPGSTVRARRGYTAPTAADLAAARKPLPDGLSEQAAHALRSIGGLGELGLQVFAAPFMGAGGSGSVLLGAQLGGNELALGGNASIEITRVAIDAAGAIHEGARRTFTLDLSPATLDLIASAGLQYFDRLHLDPGRHEIRLAVTQPGGGTGSVVTHVDVPDFAREPLTMSGLVVSSGSDSMLRTLLRDDAAARALGAEPTVSRRFARGDVLALWAEIYDSRAARSTLEVTTTVAPAGLAAVMSRRRLVTPRDPGAAIRTLEYRDRIELTSLEPGVYVLTVEARAPDGRGRTSRSVPFTVH